MNKTFVIFLTLSFLSLINVASAAFYAGYSGSDFYFEVYKGTTYSYYQTPYTYTVNDYYYFDYPFRAYSYGSYQYFQPGWYSFADPYWSFASTGYLNYTYYPADYYYYNSNWSYYPDWVLTYGPVYYGSYYLPPGQATLTGQSYHPAKQADCSEIEIITRNLSISSGKTEQVEFTLENKSKKYMDVENVSVYFNDSGLKARDVEFEKVISNKSFGVIKFDLEAKDGSENEIVRGTIETAVTFRDGTFCSSSELKEDFTVNVGNAVQKSAVHISTNPVESTVKGSTAYIVAKEGAQQWKDVENRDVVNFKKYGDKYENDSKNGSDKIKPYYAQEQLRVSSCGDLGISAENVSLDSEHSKTTYALLNNFAPEDFFIDTIEALEFSAHVSIEALRDARVIYSGQNGAVKLKFFANNSADDKTAAAYLKVKGHYKSGFGCTVTSDGFYISINGNRETEDRFLLHLDDAKTLEGEAGFIGFGFTNPTEKTVEINVFTDSAIIGNTEFVLQPNTSGSRTVAVNGVKKETKIYFSAKSGDRTFLQKYMTVVPKTIVMANEPEDQVEVEDENNTPGPIAAGFLVLQQNALLLGLIILALIIGIILARSQDKSTENTF